MERDNIEDGDSNGNGNGTPRKVNLFSPLEIGQLGVVPQLFGVVQPIGTHYSVGFFSSINIKPFGPNVPNYLMQPNQLKNFLLTKIYNGLVMCNYCPPVNRLFYVPRKETIASIILKYPPEKSKTDKKNRPLLKENQHTLQRIKERIPPTPRNSEEQTNDSPLFLIISF